MEAAARTAAELKLRSLEEAPLSKPQGLYTYAVTSSCQLRESFYNNRSLINTSSNSTNHLIYNRSDSFYAANSLRDATVDNTTATVTVTVDQTKAPAAEMAAASASDGQILVDPVGAVNNPASLIEPMEPIKNTRKNRRIFKDLDFIYNEQQVFKLSRQIWWVLASVNQLIGVFVFLDLELTLLYSLGKTKLSEVKLYHIT